VGRLDDKVAVVTGASDRLGRAIARALAMEGADIIVHYHSAEYKAQETVKLINDLGRQAIAVQADLAEPDQAFYMIDEAVNHFGSLSILVNDAALFERGGIVDTTPANWDRQFNLNLRAPFFLSQRFFLSSRDAGRHIVNLAGVRGFRMDPGRIVYSLTKAGIIELTRVLALACAPSVSVNAVAPGAILPPTGETEHSHDDLVKKIPLIRWGTVDDIVQAVLYFVTSSYITGVVIPVSGGSHVEVFDV